jgi:hypothetical protein
VGVLEKDMATLMHCLSFISLSPCLLTCSMKIGCDKYFSEVVGDCNKNPMHSSSSVGLNFTDTHHCLSIQVSSGQGRKVGQ